MRAKDIMTTSVVCVTLDTKVEEIAGRLLAHHVSGVPVLDDSNRLVGMVSEGDLMRRADLGTEPRQRAWWLDFLTQPQEGRLEAFIRSHARRAEDVMSRNVLTVAEDTPIGEIAHLLESRQIKRVPVVRDGAVVGIVSRANLIRGLASRIPVEVSADDEAIRKAFDNLIKHEGWMTHGCLNATVSDGAVEVWGWAESEAERKAIQLAVESIAGVRETHMHVGLIAPYLRGA